MARWAGLVLCCCFLAAGAAGPANEPAAEGPSDYDEDLSAIFGQGHAPGGLVGRRLLFGFSMPNVGGMVDSAVKWAEETAHHASGVSNSVTGILGLTQAASIFSNSTVWVEKGVEVAVAAWQSMMGLASRLAQIFKDFTPLQPIFADKNGLTKLLTSRGDMRTLVTVVRELFNTTSELQSLSGALNSVSEMFAEFQDLFKGLLGKVSGSSVQRRRLMDDYLSLLRGINFEELVKQVQAFLKKISRCAVQLTEVQDVLGPLLLKMEGFLGNGRRLDVSDLAANQQRYASAISKIVPTWKEMEGTGVEMCPKVLEVKATAESLKCRVTSFAATAVLPTWASNMVAGLVDKCGANPASEPTSRAAVAAGCPQSSLSSGVVDLLGQNSSQLGWILAILGVLGCLGATGTAGAAGARAMRARADPETTESGTEGEVSENEPFRKS